MVRLILRAVLFAFLAVDLFFAIVSITMIINPGEGQTAGGGVAALVFFLIVALILAILLLQTLTAQQKKHFKAWTDRKAAEAQAKSDELKPPVQPARPQVSPTPPVVPTSAASPHAVTPASPAPQPAPAAPMVTMPQQPTPPAPQPRRMTPSVHPTHRRGHMRGREWIPPVPGNDIIIPWGRCEDRIDVVGEQFRKGVFRKIMGREPGFLSQSGAVITDPAILVHDGDNPFSKSGNAIAVYIRGAHVGYIPDDLTRVWGPTMRALAAEGKDLQVDARIWAIGTFNGENAAVTVNLPQPDAIIPSNGLPTLPHAIIPVGRKRQVTGEENHMDTLVDLVVRDGSNHVSAVLRSVTEIRPRSTTQAVQVEINGKRVGVMSDVQSKNLLPLVTYIEARGLLPVCRADVLGTTIKAEVVLYCADASEVPHEWLDALGPELPTPTEVIPGPDWDWDDEDETVDEATLRVRRERERRGE